MDCLCSSLVCTHQHEGVEAGCRRTISEMEEAAGSLLENFCMKPTCPDVLQTHGRDGTWMGKSWSQYWEVCRSHSYLEAATCQESSSVTLRSIILMRIDNHWLTSLCGMHKTSCKSMELLNPHWYFKSKENTYHLSCWINAAPEFLRSYGPHTTQLISYNSKYTSSPITAKVVPMYPFYFIHRCLQVYKRLTRFPRDLVFGPELACLSYDLPEWTK